MSLRQPTTEPPTNGFGERFDRYSKHLDRECPVCGSVGLDLWLTEGATEYRAVCVESGCVVEEVETDE